MIADYPDTVSIIDGHYFHPVRAGAYLLVDGDEAAFVDNITRFSVPNLLDTLAQQGRAPEQVRYIIVTHVHLDHSGGSAELRNHCPNAEILCHPSAAKHIIDPSRLVAGAKMVYGDEAFAELYGEIEPVPKEFVRIVQDNETVPLGDRTLTFIDTPGHAYHQHAVHDSRTNSVFAGDAFGSTYQQLQGGTRPHFTYVCAPSQFEPKAAKASVQRILDTGCENVFVTHYGGTPDVEEGAEQLCAMIDRLDAVALRAADTGLEDAALFDYCSEGVLTIIEDALKEAGLDPAGAEVREWATKEQGVSSMGLQILVQKRRKEAAETA